MSSGLIKIGLCLLCGCGLGLLGWQANTQAQQPATEVSEPALTGSAAGRSDPAAATQPSATPPATAPAADPSAATQGDAKKPVDTVAAVTQAIVDLGLDPAAYSNPDLDENRDEDTRITLTGTIVTSDGSPLPQEAIIRSWSTDGDDSGISRGSVEPSGKFSIKTRRNEVYLAAEVPGWAPKIIGPNNILPGKESEPINITLDVGHVFNVSVTDSDGKPVSKAYATLTATSPHLDSKGINNYTRTNDGGHGTILHVPEGPCGIAFSTFRHYKTVRYYDVNGDMNLTAKLARRKPITGVVVNAKTGKPIADAVVVLVKYTDDPRIARNTGEGMLDHTRSDAQGRFSVTSDEDEDSMVLIETRDKRTLCVYAQDGQDLVCPMPEPLVVRGHMTGDLNALNKTPADQFMFTWTNDLVCYGQSRPVYHSQSTEMKGYVLMGDKHEFELYPVFPGKLQITAGGTVKTIDVQKSIMDLEVQVTPVQAKPQPAEQGEGEGEDQPQGRLDSPLPMDALTMNDMPLPAVVLAGAVGQPGRPQRPVEDQPDPQPAQPVPPQPVNPQFVQMPRNVIVRLNAPQGAPPVAGSVRIYGTGLSEDWRPFTNGTFSFDIQPIDFVSFRFSKMPGMVVQDDSVLVREGNGPQVKEISVQLAGAIRCKVVDTQGRPVSRHLGVSFDRQFLSKGFRQYDMSLLSMREPGVHLITPLPLGTPIQIYTDRMKEQRRMCSTGPIILTPQQPVQDVTLVIPDGKIYTIHVLDPQGKPVPGARVDLYWSMDDDTDSDNKEYHTDGNGELVLDRFSIETGIWTALISDVPGCQQMKGTLDTQQDQTTFTLQPGHVLRGIVLDGKTGRPVLNMPVLADPYDQGYTRRPEHSEFAFTNARGEFEFTTLAPIQYSISTAMGRPKVKSTFFGMGGGDSWPRVLGGRDAKVRLEISPYGDDTVGYLMSDEILATIQPNVAPADGPSATQPADSAVVPQVEKP